MYYVNTSRFVYKSWMSDFSSLLYKFNQIQIENGLPIHSNVFFGCENLHGQFCSDWNIYTFNSRWFTFIINIKVLVSHNDCSKAELGKMLN